MKGSILSARCGAGMLLVAVLVAVGIPIAAWSSADEIFSDRFEEKPLFFRDANGITIRCPEAEIGASGMVDGITYTKRSRDQITPENAATTCTSGITDMRSLFYGQQWSFNADISHWDTSLVTNMSEMFSHASAFNQPLDGWDVSAVTSMSHMFFWAESFNQPLDSWNVSGVTNMEGMFGGASAFNRPLDGWDVSAVTSMSHMFAWAE